MTRRVPIVLSGRTGRNEIGHLHKLYRQSERANKAAILEMIERRARGRLLDCGCGDGTFTVQVACHARVSEAYGTEYVDQRIKEAFDRGVIVTKAEPSDPLPYKSRFFDIVHASPVIEHLLDADLFLGEIKRVLRGDGYAILSVNNLATWQSLFCPPPQRQSTLSPPRDETTAGGATGPPQPMNHPLEGNDHPRVLDFQELPELWHYHGFRVERLTFARYYPLILRPPGLAAKPDTLHAAFLTARLRPRH